MLNFCTVISGDYGPYVDGLAGSLQEIGCDFQLFTLVVGGEVPEFASASVVPITVSEIETVRTRQLEEKYLQAGMTDQFRWSMKSVLLLYLLGERKLDKVIFVDPDIAFFSDPSFLFEALDRSMVLLTPHWRCPVPERDPINFGILQTSGLYNAGFVGVSRGAEEALNWWAEVCLYRCEVNTSEGLFVDQAYLDLLPVYFEGVDILRHRGCNVANWNLSENRRETSDDGMILVGGDPLVFVHFTGSTIRGILSGEDPELQPCLDRWIEWGPREEFGQRERLHPSESRPENEKPTHLHPLRTIAQRIFRRLKNYGSSSFP